MQSSDGASHEFLDTCWYCVQDPGGQSMEVVRIIEHGGGEFGAHRLEPAIEETRLEVVRRDEVNIGVL
jgi:hypothetical protein